MDGQIAVKAMQGFLHKQHEATSREMGVKEVLYLSSDADLSTDESRPNIFESTNHYEFKKGQPQFDIFTQEESPALFNGNMVTYGEAVGHLVEDNYLGKFFGGADIRMDVPGAQTITLDMSGTFRLKLAAS
ncbi:hypothetical protein J2W51_003437 [Tardiphaga robiniae]|uniref:hypothetical protein n=1 Tax=Tardiphaga robiniae TaxID=943830 RepID=UPI0028644036|nr:hypothetical protein [Tardiphaga robiniae]MDR6660867.1 hypothetical protein [Tardiphaga robiniae]